MNVALSSTTSQQIKRAAIANMMLYPQMSQDILAKKFLQMYDGTSGQVVRYQEGVHDKRWADIPAAAYLGALAYTHDNGADCVDHFGYEASCKLRTLDENTMTAGSQGGVRSGSKTIGALTTNLRIYNRTITDEPMMDTAIILRSTVLQSVIDGYMIPGRVVRQLVNSKIEEELKKDPTATGELLIPISIAFAQENGYRIASSMPHITYEKWRDALPAYLTAKKNGASDSHWAVKPFLQLREITAQARL